MSTCRWPLLLAAALIVLAGLAAYANSFSGPFIYDDLPSIPNNPTLRHLWPMWQVLAPHANGRTVGGRPLLNLSFAVNCAIHGVNVRGYHATNLAIHLLNGLLLLGILRHTLQLPAMRPRFGRATLGLAFVTALLWTVHPLQTESVTYIVQRAESLAAMFYLLTLYAVIRGWESGGATRWYGVAVVACWLGAATKEIVATAPLVVLLYDRTFLSGSFREAMRRRWGVYLGLAASWGLLAGLIMPGEDWQPLQEVRPPDRWSYLRSQPAVILHYLRLSVWPYPLCLDYGWPIAKTLEAIVPATLVVIALLAATVKGVVARRGWGFLGAWFFLILAPTSSVVPLAQLAFEHRMYLPLAAVLTLLVAGIYLVAQQAAVAGRIVRLGGLGLILLTATILGLLTFQRNAVYHDAIGIWQDTISKAPHNPQARNSLALLLTTAGRTAEAIEQLEEALRLQPDSVSAHNNLGFALGNSGRLQECIQHYQEAVRLNPEHYAAHNNLGLALTRSGQLQEAIEHYQRATQIQPDFASAYSNWGIALTTLGRANEAIPCYQQALRIQPNSAEVHSNLGNALINASRAQEAIEHYQQAMRLNPQYAEARFNLCVALAAAGHPRDAIEHGKQAARLLPNLPQAPRFVAWLLAIHEPSEGGDPKQAVELAEQACGPTNRRDPVCLDTLAAAYASAGRFNEAITTANEARRLAESLGHTALAQEIHMRLQLYRDHKPYREPASRVPGR